MKTLSCIYAPEEEIEIGKTYYFGQLWNDIGGVLKLVSGCVTIDGILVKFKILEENENDVLKSKIKITGLY